jgi:hypothetical protein
MDFSTLEILFLFFRKEFRDGTYPPLWGGGDLKNIAKLLKHYISPY